MIICQQLRDLSIGTVYVDILYKERYEVDKELFSDLKQTVMDAARSGQIKHYLFGRKEDVEKRIK